MTASGRTRALLLNGVLVSRGLAAPSRALAPAAEPSLRRFAAMAAVLPATPPATHADRTLRRTRSGDALHHAPHRADAPPPQQRRLHSAGSPMQMGEAERMRAVSPLFSFRCPITHVRVVRRSSSRNSHSAPAACIGRR